MKLFLFLFFPLIVFAKEIPYTIIQTHNGQVEYIEKKIKEIDENGTFIRFVPLDTIVIGEINFYQQLYHYGYDSTQINIDRALEKTIEKFSKDKDFYCQKENSATVVLKIKKPKDKEEKESQKDIYYDLIFKDRYILSF